MGFSGTQFDAACAHAPWAGCPASQLSGGASLVFIIILLMATPAATPEEIADEARKVRRLQLMMDLVMSVISQNDAMSIEEASELIASARRAALNLFPGKELAYDLIYRPRFQRLMAEKYRIQ
jgi:hypothetical protein